jgi:hypothetical protein
VSKARIFAALALSIPFLAGPASAETSGPVFSLTPSFGLQTGFQFGRLVPLPGTADVPEVLVSLEHKGPIWGLAFGWEIGRRFELLVDASFSPTRIINDVGIGIGGIPLGKIKASDAALYALAAGLRFHFAPGRLSLYVAAGGGAAVLNTERLGTKAKPFLLLETGVRVRFSEHLRATLEFRDVVTFFRYDKDFDVYYLQIYRPDFKGTQHAFGLLIGFGYAFRSR